MNYQQHKNNIEGKLSQPLLYCGKCSQILHQCLYVDSNTVALINKIEVKVVIMIFWYVKNGVSTIIILKIVFNQTMIAVILFSIWIWIQLKRRRGFLQLDYKTLILTVSLRKVMISEGHSATFCEKNQSHWLN